MDELRFDDAVVVVTGAGRGLGRAHALLFASRGACVVVNDRGQCDDGQPSAEAVVREIEALGGRAVACVSSVGDPEGIVAIVDAAHGVFGPVDVLVNNAGVARPAPLRRLDAKDLRLELAVHLEGTILLTQALWGDLGDRGTGAVVNTTSGVGLFGMGGTTGYAAAKMGIVGATKVWALEGAARGIRANAIAPIAKTAMAGDVFGDLSVHLDPTLVSSVVAWLAHPSCPLTGQVVSAGGGRVARVAIEVGAGSRAEDLSPEDVAALAPAFLDGPTVPLADAMAEADMIAALIGPAPGINR